jgi:uncharacterized protein YbaA (DUF1428 family)
VIWQTVAAVCRCSDGPFAIPDHEVGVAPPPIRFGGHRRLVHTAGNQGRFSMARYVDGFVLPVPKKKVNDYRRMAQKASKVWRDHGALEYIESVGDDLQVKWGKTFPRSVKTKPGETVVFAWIVYKSRAHRDRVNAKVMKDPRMGKMMDDAKSMPFDYKRMTYGGFKIIVE